MSKTMTVIMIYADLTVEEKNTDLFFAWSQVSDAVWETRVAWGPEESGGVWAAGVRYPNPESRDSPWRTSGSPVTQANSFVKKKRDLIEVLSPSKSSKTEKDQEICKIEPDSTYNLNILVWTALRGKKVMLCWFVWAQEGLGWWSVSHC